MKTAKSFPATRTAVQLTGTSGLCHTRSGKRASIPKRIPREELEPFARGGVSSTDSVVITKLRTALAGIDDALMEACGQRKLLPFFIVNRINMARLLSNVMLAARAAQKITGVPASILVSEVWHLSLYELMNGLSACEQRNDPFNTGTRFPSLEAAFLDHANRLTRDRRFQPVLRAKVDPVEYLKQLGLCKLWDDMGRMDRVSTITEDGLQECDALPSSETE